MHSHASLLSQDWIRVLKFWRDSRDFAPASTRQKKYLEGSPDEGGDSVATAAVIRTVARTVRA